MTLSIKTKEADRLARELAALTGETTAQAVTRALAERLDRLTAERREADTGPIVERVRSFAERIGHRYDRRPISEEEWAAAGGDDADIAKSRT